MPHGVTRAAYPRFLLCDGLRCRGGSAFAFANLLIEPGRLSPPIWPCTTWGFPCSRYCYRDGGLLPHLFTLAKRISFSKTSRRFPCAMPPCCFAGGIFSVALSVTEPHHVGLNPTPLAEASNSTLQRSLRGRPLALPGALPLIRHRLLRAYDDGVRTFVQSPLLRTSDHPARPLMSL